MPPTILTFTRIRARTALMVTLALVAGCGPEDPGPLSDWVQSREQHAVISMASAMSYARKAGLPCDNNLIIAGAIARAESGLNTTAVGGPNYNGSYDYGLWQINNKAHPQYSKSCLLSPSCNAKAMVGVSSGGKYWKPWVVYWKGYYTKYLPAAKAAYPSVCAPPNKAPVGYLDGADSKCNALYGWAQDPDAPHKALTVHVYFNGPAGSKGAYGVNAGKADGYRSDLCKAIKSCKHGFSVKIPVGLRDSKPHKAYAYTFDSKTGKPVALKNYPRTFTCKPPAVPLGPAKAFKRWVTGPSSFTRWKMSYINVFHVTSAQAKAYPTGKPMPPTPLLVQAKGEAAVWLLDSGQRRHVLNPASMKAWGLSFSQVQTWPKSQVALYPKGPHWPAKRHVLLAKGGSVYALDSLAAPTKISAPAGTVQAAPKSPAGADPGAAPPADAGPGDGEPAAGDGGWLSTTRMSPPGTALAGSCSAGGAPGGGLPLLPGLLLVLALRGRGREGDR